MLQKMISGSARLALAVLAYSGDDGLAIFGCLGPSLPDELRRLKLLCFKPNNNVQIADCYIFSFIYFLHDYHTSCKRRTNQNIARPKELWKRMTHISYLAGLSP